MTNPSSSTPDLTSATSLPPEAEAIEVIQTRNIRHAFGSAVVLAPFSFLFLILHALFNAVMDGGRRVRDQEWSRPRRQGGGEIMMETNDEEVSC
jgi:hypothetical protein